MIVDVRVIPRARQTAFGGERDGVFIIRLVAPPVEGAANEALVTFLADRLGLPRRAVRIVRGERSRNKRIEIIGVTVDQLRDRLS